MKIFDERALAIMIGLILAMIVALVTFFSAKSIPTIIFDWELNSSYFGSDSPRVWINLTDRYSNHYRTNVHPLFSITVGLPTLTLTKAGLDKLTAFSAIAAINAALLMSLVYYLLLFITKRIFDTLAFSCLFITSASFVYWAKFPETFSFGATSILVPFVVLTMPLLRDREWAHWAANVVSMSLTVTNWMSGLASSFFALPLKRTLILAFKTMVVVAALWSIQKFLYPLAGHFLDLGGEKRYIRATNMGFALRQFFLDSLYPIGIEEGFSQGMNRPTVNILRNAGGWPAAGTVAVWSAWIGIVLFGCLRCWQDRGNSAANKALLLFLAGQIVLHSLYGTHETFMYSLHWMPTLIFIAAFAARGRFRPLVLIIIAVLVVVIGPRNFSMNQESLAIAAGFQEHVLEQRRAKAESSEWQ